MRIHRMIVSHLVKRNQSDKMSYSKLHSHSCGCSKWPAIGAACLLPNLAGFLQRGYYIKSEEWYKTLQKPSWNPPKWVFAPAWTTLYTGMGYASYLVFQSTGCCWKNKGATLPLLLYSSQLALNWAWSPIFFKYQSPKWALVDISLLTILATACGYSFYKVNHCAGWLFVPYVAWLSFATALNYVIWRDNRPALPSP